MKGKGKGGNDQEQLTLAVQMNVRASGKRDAAALIKEVA